MARTDKVYTHVQREIHTLVSHVEDLGFLGSNIVKAEAGKMHVMVDGLFQYLLAQFLVVKIENCIGGGILLSSAELQLVLSWRKFKFATLLLLGLSNAKQGCCICSMPDCNTTP